jgi:hypothetical protein
VAGVRPRRRGLDMVVWYSLGRPHARMGWIRPPVERLNVRATGGGEVWSCGRPVAALSGGRGCLSGGLIAFFDMGVTGSRREGGGRLIFSIDIFP